MLLVEILVGMVLLYLAVLLAGAVLVGALGVVALSRTCTAVSPATRARRILKHGKDWDPENLVIFGDREKMSGGLFTCSVRHSQRAGTLLA
jgi:hypothetical protein